MKSLLVTLVTIGVAIGVQADVFIGPSSATNKLVVKPSHLAIVYRVVPPEPTLEHPNQPIYWVTSTSTNTLALGGESNVNPTALTGPGELVLNESTVVSLTLLPAANAHTVFVPILLPGVTVTLSIPPGKSFRFFQPLGFEYALTRLERGDLVVEKFQIRGGDVLNGPLEVKFIPLPERPAPFQPEYFVSYIENEEALVFPGAAAIRTPAGTSLLQVQSSTDLEGWAPAIELPVSNLTERFYRLRVQFP